MSINDRFAAEQSEYTRTLAAREARTERTRGTPGRTPPEVPEPGPRPKDQVKVTNPALRIVPTAGGFAQAENAQSGVPTETHLIVAQHVTNRITDKQEIGPAPARSEALPETLGAVEALLADTGDRSRENSERCATAGIGPCIPASRQRRNPPLAERLADNPPAPEGRWPLRRPT